MNTFDAAFWAAITDRQNLETFAAAEVDAQQLEVPPGVPPEYLYCYEVSTDEWAFPFPDDARFFLNAHLVHVTEDSMRNLLSLYRYDVLTRARWLAVHKKERARLQKN